MKKKKKYHRVRLELENASQPLLSPAHEESLLCRYDITCQYKAVDIVTAKVIATEEIYVI